MLNGQLTSTAAAAGDEILSNYLPLHIVCDATGAKPRPANVSQFNSYVRLIYGIFGARTGKCV